MNEKKLNIPNHIGIIMDGNGRWATKRGLTRLVGHKKGAEAVKRVVRLAQEFDVKVLSLFAFSTENWKREESEVNGIFEIMQNFIDKHLKDIEKINFSFRVMGNIKELPEKLALSISEIVEKTKDNSGLILNLAINYGGRDEIIYAINKILKQGKTSISLDEFSEALYTNNLPDLDLIIRTSGEMRLSNFMLFQSAYAELYFTKTYWPSFGRKDFVSALESYSKRERRFGGTNA